MWLRILLTTGVTLTAGLFVLIALVVAGAIPPYALAFISLGIWGPLSLVGWAVISRRVRFTERMRTTGLAARGTVTGVWPTNTYINYRQVLRIGLSVALPGQPAYPTTLRHAPPPWYAPLIRPGATLPVLVDPTNPAAVLVEWLALEDTPGVSTP
jgi:hypothetical protein